MAIIDNSNNDFPKRVNRTPAKTPSEELLCHLLETIKVEAEKTRSGDKDSLLSIRTTLETLIKGRDSELQEEEFRRESVAETQKQTKALEEIAKNTAATAELNAKLEKIFGGGSDDGFGFGDEGGGFNIGAMEALVTALLGKELVSKLRGTPQGAAPPKGSKPDADKKPTKTGSGSGAGGGKNDQFDRDTNKKWSNFAKKFTPLLAAGRLGGWYALAAAVVGGGLYAYLNTFHDFTFTRLFEDFKKNPSFLKFLGDDQVLSIDDFIPEKLTNPIDWIQGKGDSTLTDQPQVITPDKPLSEMTPKEKAEYTRAQAEANSEHAAQEVEAFVSGLGVLTKDAYGSFLRHVNNLPEGALQAVDDSTKTLKEIQLESERRTFFLDDQRKKRLDLSDEKETQADQHKRAGLTGSGNYITDFEVADTNSDITPKLNWGKSLDADIILSQVDDQRLRDRTTETSSTETSTPWHGRYFTPQEATDTNTHTIIENAALLNAQQLTKALESWNKSLDTFAIDTPHEVADTTAANKLNEQETSVTNTHTIIEKAALLNAQQLTKALENWNKSLDTFAIDPISNLFTIKIQQPVDDVAAMQRSTGLTGSGNHITNNYYDNKSVIQADPIIEPQLEYHGSNFVVTPSSVIAESLTVDTLPPPNQEITIKDSNVVVDTKDMRHDPSLATKSWSLRDLASGFKSIYEDVLDLLPYDESSNETLIRTAAALDIPTQQPRPGGATSQGHTNVAVNDNGIRNQQITNNNIHANSNITIAGGMPKDTAPHQSMFSPL